MSAVMDQRIVVPGALDLAGIGADRTIEHSNKRNSLAPTELAGFKPSSGPAERLDEPTGVGDGKNALCFARQGE